MTTCPCMMQSYVCKEMGKNIIYLSPMNITQMVIMGYDVPDDHERRANLNPQEREEAQKELCNELKYNMGMYMYRAMNKVRECGSIIRCMYSQFRLGSFQHLVFLGESFADFGSSCVNKSFLVKWM